MSEQLPLPIPNTSAPRKSKGLTAGIAVVQNGVTVTENRAKNGIEIRFDVPPDAAIERALNDAGFRHSHAAGCWYSITCDAAKVFAYSLSV
jgi:hypothetical protein